MKDEDKNAHMDQYDEVNKKSEEKDSALLEDNTESVSSGGARMGLLVVLFVLALVKCAIVADQLMT